MIEEVNELYDDPCIEEAADIYEVFMSLLWIYDFDYIDVVNAAAAKRNERGSFKNGIVLEAVIEKSKK